MLWFILSVRVGTTFCMFQMFQIQKISKLWHKLLYARVGTQMCIFQFMVMSIKFPLCFYICGRFVLKWQPLSRKHVWTNLIFSSGISSATCFKRCLWRCFPSAEFSHMAHPSADLGSKVVTLTFRLTWVETVSNTSTNLPPCSLMKMTWRPTKRWWDQYEINKLIYLCPGCCKLYMQLFYSLSILFAHVFFIVRKCSILWTSMQIFSCTFDYAYYLYKS